jgi:DNA uptake protein ComE-like DNA-binding protein
MKQLHSFISLYFNLSRKEANGFIILSFLIPVFIFLPWMVRFYSSSDATISSQDQKVLNQLLAQIKDEHAAIHPTPSQSKKTSNTTLIIKSFDPNINTADEMKAAGIPGFIADRIVKFRSKGGVFKKKEDLKKIYGVSSSFYDQLSPHISIENNTNPISEYKMKGKQEIRSFNLNTGDSLTLVALKGIGPTLSARILKYRHALGGFISLNQLSEIYGLDSTALEELKKFSFIEKEFIPRKVDLNTSDKKHLQQHPYIGKKITEFIFRYREQHGDFSSPEELTNIKSISSETYRKMLPYLK